jgi:hypothetical protein
MKKMYYAPGKPDLIQASDLSRKKLKWVMTVSSIPTTLIWTLLPLKPRTNFNQVQGGKGTIVAKVSKEETNLEVVKSEESFRSIVVPRRSGRARQTNIRIRGYELDGALVEKEIPQRNEILLIGAGIGGGFDHTKQLIALTFNQVLQQENDEELEKWADAVDVEHQRMMDNDLWIPVLSEQTTQMRFPSLLLGL